MPKDTECIKPKDRCRPIFLHRACMHTVCAKYPQNAHAQHSSATYVRLMALRTDAEKERESARGRGREKGEGEGEKRK